MKTIIHVNQHIIKANKKNGTNLPPITVKTYKETKNASMVSILGGSTLIYNPRKPLDCGAHVWLETFNTVISS